MTLPVLSGEPHVDSPRRGMAVMGKSVIVKGQIFSCEDLTIDGEVEGVVELQEHRLTVGPAGKVIAAVKAREVVVLGTIHGNIEAADKVEIRKEAKLVGDVKTARIVIEDGAYFKGSIDIVRSLAQSDLSVLEDRYAKLVEKKYLKQLSKSEEAEMESLATRLSHAEGEFYNPILQKLRAGDRPALGSEVTTRETTR